MSEKEDALEQRKSEATSDETAADVSKQEGGAGSATGPAPSPDGRLDEPDELKDADAM